MKPLAAEMSRTPFTLPSPLPFVDPGLRPPAPFPTNCSTPGEEVAAIPSMPKSLVVLTPPCLRNPMPACVMPLLVLPAVVLPRRSRQTASSAEDELPASTRMPGRRPPSGAATVLLRMPRLARPLVLRPTSRIPLPSVSVMLFVLRSRWYQIGIRTSDCYSLTVDPMACPHDLL